MYTKKTISIAGFPIVATTSSVLARYLLYAMRINKKITLFFANTNFIVQSTHLLDKMKSESVTIVNDGVGMDIAAFLFRRDAFKENLNGTDFVPQLLLGADGPKRVFMVGGKPEILPKAVEHMRSTLKQVVVGSCDGYADLKQRRAGLVEEINRTRAEIVLVALGNPMQEEWILVNRQVLDATVVIGVGALFDFWGGFKPRAPQLVQKMRLEWLYRLCLEPRRLLRRYTVDILKFLLLCRKYDSGNQKI